MKKYSLIVLAVILIGVGCSKEKKDPVPEVPIEGYYFGTYKINGFTSKYNTAMLVRPGGTMRFYELGFATDTMFVSSDFKIDGTWTFSDNVFKFAFSVGSNTATTALVPNATRTELNGTYSIDGVITGTMQYKK